MDNILSVRELTEKLRASLTRNFPYVWVKGEVTNLSRPSSGHVYFSLKDGDALLDCAWFRQRQQAKDFDPLTGEVWEDGPRPSFASSLKNGQEVACAGELSVYGARSVYQLKVEMAQPTGQGAWSLAFEELKRKLAALGYFDQARKRPIPYGPSRVAVITAATGAVIHDFMRIAGTRGLAASIRLHPTPVQGDEAPPRIVEALEEANRQAWAEVIVLIRGGGSLQDLWAFNDERVARAVFESRLPVLTGVGHEIDHSIADFVADMAAATPSHTAQLLWPERADLARRVDEWEMNARAACEGRLRLAERELAYAEHSLRLLSPSERLKARQESLIRAVKDLDSSLARRLGGAALRLERLAERLPSLGSSLCLRHEHALEKLALRLEAHNPLAPLERGYALVRGAGGRLVRSAHDVSGGDALTLELHDGAIFTHVDEISEGTLSPP